MPWKAFLARVVVAGAIMGVFVAGAVVVGVSLAVADPAGPPTRNAFTYAGVLSNPDGGPTTSPTMLRFVFRRTGMPDCTPTPVRAEPNSRGAFSVPVAIDGCGSAFFNGTDVNYDVFVVGEDAALASNVAVTPVPYARFADQVGPEAHDSGTFTTANRDIVLRRSALFPVGYRDVTSRPLLLTVRASGDGVENTSLWLVITGGQSGPVVQGLATHRYVGVAAVTVIPTGDQGVFTVDDTEQGVTLQFRNFPTTRVSSWSYTVQPVGLGGDRR